MARIANRRMSQAVKVQEHPKLAKSLRPRSKSVHFDQTPTVAASSTDDVESSLNQNDAVTSPGSATLYYSEPSDDDTLVNNVPNDMDMSSQTPANEIASTSCSSSNPIRNVSIGTASSSNGTALSSAETLSFENRINGLVASNMTKINRIKALQAERDDALEQVATLHRLNRSLAETVDLYRCKEDEGNKENRGDSILQRKLTSLQTVNFALRDRIGENNREIFELKEEKSRLNSILSTHGQKVRAEHNYSLN